MPGRESISVMSRSKPTVGAGRVVEAMAPLCRAPDACPWAPGTTANEPTLAVQRVRPDPGPPSPVRRPRTGADPGNGRLAPPAALSPA